MDHHSLVSSTPGFIKHSFSGYLPVDVPVFLAIITPPRPLQLDYELLNQQSPVIRMPSRESTLPPTILRHRSLESLLFSPGQLEPLAAGNHMALDSSSDSRVFSETADTGREHPREGLDISNRTNNPDGRPSGFTSLFNRPWSEAPQPPPSSNSHPEILTSAPGASRVHLIRPIAPESTLGHPLGLPKLVFAHITLLLEHCSFLAARSTSRSWLKACTESRPLYFSPLYRLPVELVQLILTFTAPASFHSAQHVCRAWYRSSLSLRLLRLQLKALGFYHTDGTIKNSENAHYLSTRLSREISLGVSSRSGVHQTATVDLSNLAATETVHFTVSICGSYVLLSEGCVVYVYRLQATSTGCIQFVASVVCPRRVLAVSMDTSSRRFAIAILFDGRMGLVHDVVEQEAKSTYRNLCSEEDAPRSVAICPQRRCVAFGCHGGIELHWVDALTGQDLNRWFPLTAPSDFLYFLPPRRGIDSSKKLRLISSAVHPQESGPLAKRFGVGRGSLAFWGSWEPRVGQSDHFQAVPLSDGYHILFMDPETGGLCLGSDAPLGGPTKLLRKVWLMPPLLDYIKKVDPETRKQSRTQDDGWKVEEHVSRHSNRPSVYASGADMRFGVRVVAGYGDHIILFSIPPDVFNGSDIESRTTNTSLEPDPHRAGPSSAERLTEEPWQPVTIIGSQIGTLPRLIDLAIDSGPNMTVYAFSANGQIAVYQLEKTSATVPTRDQLNMISRRSGEIVEASWQGGDCWGELYPLLDGEGENGQWCSSELYLRGMLGVPIPDDSGSDYTTGVRRNACRIDYLL